MDDVGGVGNDEDEGIFIGLEECLELFELGGGEEFFDRGLGLLILNFYPSQSFGLEILDGGGELIEFFSGVVLCCVGEADAFDHTFLL